MTPEQIKKHEQMNINNLYEAVPVEKELPPVDKSDRDWETLKWSEDVFVNTTQGIDGAFYAYREKTWYSNGKVLSGVTHWLRPVTRESIEAFLREFGEKVWDISEAYNSNIDEEVPDKQTAITELIKQYTHPAPLGDKQ